MGPSFLLLQHAYLEGEINKMHLVDIIVCHVVVRFQIKHPLFFCSILIALFFFIFKTYLSSTTGKHMHMLRWSQHLLCVASCRGCQRCYKSPLVWRRAICCRRQNI